MNQFSELSNDSLLNTVTCNVTCIVTRLYLIIVNKVVRKSHHCKTYYCRLSLLFYLSQPLNYIYVCMYVYIQNMFPKKKTHNLYFNYCIAKQYKSEKHTIQRLFPLCLCMAKLTPSIHLVFFKACLLLPLWGKENIWEPEEGSRLKTEERERNSVRSGHSVAVADCSLV